MWLHLLTGLGQKSATASLFDLEPEREHSPAPPRRSRASSGGSTGSSPPRQDHRRSGRISCRPRQRPPFRRRLAQHRAAAPHGQIHPGPQPPLCNIERIVEIDPDDRIGPRLRRWHPWANRHRRSSPLCSQHQRGRPSAICHSSC